MGQSRRRSRGRIADGTALLPCLALRCRRPPPAKPYDAGMSRDPATKYRPLADELTAQASSPVTYTFAQIEAVTGWPLPDKADTPRWWRTGALRRQLAAAGWTVASLDRVHATATFVCVSAETRRPDSTA